MVNMVKEKRAKSKVGIYMFLLDIIEKIYVYTPIYIFWGLAVTKECINHQI